MSGSPKSGKRPPPSYEEGRLRDETIEERQAGVTYNRDDLLGLIKKAAQARDERA